jgi:membrane protease YdiL (CAAX protease family)
VVPPNSALERTSARRPSRLSCKNIERAEAAQLQTLGDWQMRSKRPALAVASLACPVLTILYIFWILEIPHDWPRGETGLIAIYAASLWSFAFLIAGVVAGTISLLRNEARRWAVGGIGFNVAAASGLFV